MSKKKNKDLKEEAAKMVPEEHTCKKENCTCTEQNECASQVEEVNQGEKIEELTKQVASLQEVLLRNQADLQNYKKRKEEEFRNFEKYKNEELMKEIIQIVDNFERAIKMDDNDLSDEVSKFLEGFKLIYGNMVNILNKFDVKEINAEGIEFDATYHHAVLTDHDETKPANVILEVLQKGYMYKDRVIRPAMVKVNE